MRLKALHSLPKPPSISDRSNFIKRRRELKELLTAVYIASFIYRQHSTSPEQYLKNSDETITIIINRNRRLSRILRLIVIADYAYDYYTIIVGRVPTSLVIIAQCNRQANASSSVF
jgi:hypothetical protein